MSPTLVAIHYKQSCNPWFRLDISTSMAYDQSPILSLHDTQDRRYSILTNLGCCILHCTPGGPLSQGYNICPFTNHTTGIRVFRSSWGLPSHWYTLNPSSRPSSSPFPLPLFPLPYICNPSLYVVTGVPSIWTNHTYHLAITSPFPIVSPCRINRSFTHSCPSGSLWNALTQRTPRWNFSLSVCYVSLPPYFPSIIPLVVAHSIVSLPLFPCLVFILVPKQSHGHAIIIYF